MRIAGFALLGFLSGAICGLICALLLVTLWYDVLDIGSRGVEGLGGVGTLLVLAVVLPLLFGAAGAVWMGLRARTAPPGGPSCALVVALVLVPLLILSCCFILVGG